MHFTTTMQLNNAVYSFAVQVEFSHFYCVSECLLLLAMIYRHLFATKDSREPLRILCPLSGHLMSMEVLFAVQLVTMFN